MDATGKTACRRAALAPRWRRTAIAVFEWWWNLDRRRHIRQSGSHDRRHPLDETFVVEAMARQLEEIRNLAELAG